MINNVKARKILSKKCMVYLAHIVNRSDEIILDVKDILVVQKFQNSFLNSLPGLAPKKEIEFNIELALDIALISKAPYRRP